MFPHALSFGVPTAVLNMTTDFTPLFVGMVLLLGFCVLALAFTFAVYDTRETKRKVKTIRTEPTSIPKAA